MKNIHFIYFFFLFAALFIKPVSAEENRNQYSKSIMFKAPEVLEDTNYKTKNTLDNQQSVDLQKKIKALEFRPVRRNATRERYKTECLNK